MQSRMAKRLQKEYESIQKNNETFVVQLVNNDLRIWLVTFEGAKNTIFAG
jgi:ubiquitin-protein ligase